MNTTTKAEQTALTIPQRAAVALGESANAAKLRELAAKSAGILTVTNCAGRDEAHRAGMVLAKTRTSIANAGKTAREDATAFSKGVIALEKDLISIIEPEEKRILDLRDRWDEKLAAEKAAKIAAERARVAAIQCRLNAIRNIPLLMNGKPSSVISDLIATHIFDVPGTDFEEFEEEAKRLHVETFNRLTAMEVVQRTAEVETARIEQARAELALLRAEADRVANEQAIERKRLADAAVAQEAVAAELRRKAEANLQADRDAQAELLRREREAADAELKRKRDEFDAQDAARRDDDHGPALVMNEQFDTDTLAAFFADAATDHDADALARCTATAKAMLTGGRSLIGIADDADDDLSDEELIDLVVEAGYARLDAIERLARFDAAAARAGMIAEQGATA